MRRMTKQRDAIEGALQRAARPLSPAEIHAAAKRRVGSISLATIYRRIKQLCAEGLAAPINLPGESPRYELHSAAQKHHHHFQCLACDRVFDLKGCPPGLAKLAPPEFTVDRHEIVLYGRCKSCA